MITVLGMIAKIPALAKIAIAGSVAIAALVSAVVIAGAPVSDPWFDLCMGGVGMGILFTVSAIVNGEPEPDFLLMIARGEATWGLFYYTWFYRSSHLWASSATAFFMHPKNWADISAKTNNAKE